MTSRPMAIGSDTEATWTESSQGPSAGRDAPRPIPPAMAAMIQAGRSLSRQPSAGGPPSVTARPPGGRARGRLARPRVGAKEGAAALDATANPVDRFRRLRDFLEERPKPRVGARVDHVRLFVPARDEARLAQHLEVVAEGTLLHLEALKEGRDRALAPGEEAQHVKPGRVAKRLEERVLVHACGAAGSDMNSCSYRCRGRRRRIQAGALLGAPRRLGRPLPGATDLLDERPPTLFALVSAQAHPR